MIVGAEFKVLVQVEPVDDVHMSQMDFSCSFYTDMASSYEVKKEQMIQLDDDSYIALVDSTGMNPGNLRNRITVDIPDFDFADGYRREIVDVETGVKLMR